MNARPLSHSSMHVVFRKDGYTFETPEIRRWLDRANLWLLEQSEPGVIIFGRPRIGKTHARMATGAFFEDRLGTSGVVYHLDIEGVSRPSRGDFFEALLKAARHSIPRKGSANDKCDRLLNHLTVEADRIRKESGGEVPTIAFCVDEAQNLWEENYQSLIYIYNSLAADGVRTIFLLFGQPSLQATRNTLRNTGQQQIVARFMAREHEFHGVCSLQDLREVLADYDTIEYPDSSGWSMTRFFFDEAVYGNHGLAEFADVMFEEFAALSRVPGLEQVTSKGIKTNIPMTYVTRVVHHIFKRFGYEGSQVSHWPTVAQVRQAVRDSGYAESELGLTPDPEEPTTRVKGNRKR